MMLQIKLREKLDIIVFVLFAALLAGGMVSANSLAVRPASTDEDSSMSQLWNIQTVASGEAFGHNSLALDRNDSPHISFAGRTSKYSGSNLYHSLWSGSEWAFQRVDQSFTGQYNSLALNAYDDPHISYYDYGNRELRYGHWKHWATGDGWSTQTVESTGDTYDETSLALDTNGNAHISYVRWYYGDGGQKSDLKYVRWIGKWDIQTVEAGRVGLYNSLAVDSNDHPHISYFDWANRDLKYTRWTGEAWETQVVDHAGDVGYFTSLALDAEDRPHISYYDWDNGKLKYARWTGATWVVQVVDSAGWVCWRTSIALDAKDRPHITYCWDFGGLKYARWTGAEWWVQNVDTNSRRSSLALDASDLAHVSYYDATSRAYKYASFEPPRLTLSKQATPSQGLRNIDPLTYTLTLSSADYNVRLWDPLPDAVRYITDSLDSSVVPAAVYSPTAHAIIWHGTLPDSLQEIRFQVTPKVTGALSHSLSLPILNTARLTVKKSAVTVSANVMVNGQRVYLPLIIEDR